MKKHEIEIEGLPEGWEPVAYRCPFAYENYLKFGEIEQAVRDIKAEYLIVKKKQPRRIVLEETDEFREAGMGEYIETADGYIHQRAWIDPTKTKYKIWREVKEPAPSLHNADDKESLRLSVHECKEILSLTLSGMVKSGAIDKLRNFIKGQS